MDELFTYAVHTHPTLRARRLGVPPGDDTFFSSSSPLFTLLHAHVHVRQDKPVVAFPFPCCDRSLATASRKSRGVFVLDDVSRSHGRAGNSV